MELDQTFSAHLNFGNIKDTVHSVSLLNMEKKGMEFGGPVPPQNSILEHENSLSTANHMRLNPF